jgi:hypothetical protein
VFYIEVCEKVEKCFVLGCARRWRSVLYWGVRKGGEVFYIGVCEKVEQCFIFEKLVIRSTINRETENVVK